MPTKTKKQVHIAQSINDYIDDFSCLVFEDPVDIEVRENQKTKDICDVYVKGTKEKLGVLSIEYGNEEKNGVKAEEFTPEEDVEIIDTVESEDLEIGV
jgi:hypothetical protein